MRPNDNVLKAIAFETPSHIPVACNINPSCWAHYSRSFLWEMVASHPTVFPWFAAADDAERRHIETPVFRAHARADEPYRDGWGCLWQTSENGIMGTVTRHPLEDWAAFEHFSAPDPERGDGLFPVDWPALARARDAAAREGRSFDTGLPHGHTFLRICDLRGYENVILDMADDSTRLSALFEMIRDFNVSVLRRQMALAPDMVSIAEDLGMQIGPMLSPGHFRKYVLPCYQAYMQVIRSRPGTLVHMHSDGDIRLLMADLLSVGIDAINLQDLINGLDWIEGTLKGKVCIDLDIDRQSVTRFGTPAEINALIGEEVRRLGSKSGGLMMIYGLYPGVPERNVAAVLDAMEKYAHHFS